MNSDFFEVLTFGFVFKSLVYVFKVSQPMGMNLRVGEALLIAMLIA